MEWYFLALIAVGIVAVFTAATTLASAILIYKSAFGARQDENPKFKYITYKDFGLYASPLKVNYNGIELFSAVYSIKPLEECDRVVIFAHGFGAGSASYMTEIARLARGGFAVVATDAYGCNNSAGREIRGFYAGAEAVIATYITVKADEKLKDKKVVLAGHSWGAYSVLAATPKISVDGVVALSSFNAPAQCVCDMMRRMGGLVKAYAPLVHGWIYLINACKFGSAGNTKAAKAVDKSGVKALLIQGELDKTVQLKHSAAKLSKGANVQKLILPDKAHNPYNTVAGEKKLAELSVEHTFASEEEEKKYYNGFDWKLATEEDEEVMTQIEQFIKEC